MAGDETPSPTLRRRTNLERLAVLIEAGKVTPIIEHTYPLHQAPDAMRHLEAGQARGKLVITVIDPDDATPEET